MKLTVEVNGKPVQIELTKEQVASVKKQSVDFKDIKTLLDAIDYLGAEDAFVKERAALSTNVGDDVKAYVELKIIAKAINGGIVMNYKDTSEYKYYPWFNAEGSDEGFSYVNYVYYFSYSHVGSRLCYLSSDRAIYAGKQFIDIYNRYINS